MESRRGGHMAHREPMDVGGGPESPMPGNGDTLCKALCAM